MAEGRRHTRATGVSGERQRAVCCFTAERRELITRLVKEGHISRLDPLVYGLPIRLNECFMANRDSDTSPGAKKRTMLSVLH